MRLEEKRIVLRDGSEGVLRSAQPQDAKELLEYLRITSEETYFMIRYPEEIVMSVEEEEEFLKAKIESKNAIMIAAFVEGELAGNTALYCLQDCQKMRHRASFGIAIKKKFWNKGLGSLLLEEILRAAKGMGYEQIELGVFEDNKAAIALYEKYGFEVWGRAKHAFKLKDGSYRDEITMGLRIV